MVCVKALSSKHWKPDVIKYMGPYTHMPCGPVRKFRAVDLKLHMLLVYCYVGLFDKLLSLKNPNFLQQAMVIVKINAVCLVSSMNSITFKACLEIFRYCKYWNTASLLQCSTMILVQAILPALITPIRLNRHFVLASLEGNGEACSSPPLPEDQPPMSTEKVCGSTVTTFCWKLLHSWDTWFPTHLCSLGAPSFPNYGS